MQLLVRNRYNGVVISSESKGRCMMRMFPLVCSLTIFGFSDYAIKLHPVIAQDLTPQRIKTTYFTGKPPQLTDTSATFSAVDVRNVKYYFTIDLPEASAQSLSKITIQQNPSPEDIEFKLSRTQAFIGTRNNRGEALALKSVIQDPQTDAINITFDPAISPATTLTIGLLAKYNPSVGGVYIFRVRAFPQGNNPTGLDLGVGRFAIYDRGYY